MKLLWCHSHLVWLVFEGSIPTCTCFHSENFFVTCICKLHACCPKKNMSLFCMASLLNGCFPLDCSTCVRPGMIVCTKRACGKRSTTVTIFFCVLIITFSIYRTVLNGANFNPLRINVKNLHALMTNDV